MNVLITGASGLLGSGLTAHLKSQGHTVAALKRGGGAAACWNPDAETVELGREDAFDSVIHLAGENIGARWTAARKRRIRDSRVNGTRLLAQALARLPQRPRVLCCASASGIYGDRGSEWLDEQSEPGIGFLADICREWEAASGAAVASGIRVVHVRLGIVLSKKGGALPKMLPAFRCGLGGRLGDGRQYWSWVAIEDAIRAIQFALETPELVGALNVTAPHPVTNSEFTAALGRAIRRPTFCAVPRIVVELLLGEMGREALLSSARVRPARLMNAGFQFHLPELEPALHKVLGVH
jgi:uncharacterized protein (TIGR01777 family)